MHVLPSIDERLTVEPERFVRARGVDGQSRQGITELLSCDAPLKLECAHMVLVEPVGQLFQHWILGVGGYPLHDQLLARHADGERVALADEQQLEAIGDALDRHSEQRMPGRVDRMLVESDRQLHQKIGQVARKGRDASLRRRRRRRGSWRRIRRRIGHGGEAVS